MSRQLLSRANQLFNGRASLGTYQQDKPGGEIHLLYRFKPTGNRAAAWTGVLAAGAVAGTLSAVWAGASGIYPITFSDGEVLNGIFVNGSAGPVNFLPASFPQVIQGSSGPYGGVGSLVNAVTATITVGGQPPILATANSIAVSQAVTGGVAALLNGATAGILDVPRNIVASWTTAATVTITGTDAQGQPQTEALSTPGGSTGKKAFATVTSIVPSVSITALIVTTGKALGLPFAVRSGDVFAMSLADAADASVLAAADGTYPATTTTGDVRGTLSPAGAFDGVKFFSALIKPIDANVQAWLFGVPPV